MMKLVAYRETADHRQGSALSRIPPPAAALAPRRASRQDRTMKRLLLATSIPLLLAAAPALAEWRLDEGVAISDPASTNSNIELVALMCGDPFQLEVYARGGPVMPADQELVADYFNKAGRVRASVDAQNFKLAASGSDGAVVLFGEGPAADGYLADLPRSLVTALRSGKVLTLGFDITEAKNADGSPFETIAVFDLAGSDAAIGEALAGCPG
jgi:hypothetical protein